MCLSIALLSKEYLAMFKSQRCFYETKNHVNIVIQYYSSIIVFLCSFFILDVCSCVLFLCSWLRIIILYLQIIQNVIEQNTKCEIHFYVHLEL